jgi:hypothetical protein
MDIIVGIFLLIGLFILATFVGEFYRANPMIFYILWLAIPIGIAIFQYSRKSHHISKKTSKWIRTIAIALTVGISFCLFAHYDDIRDNIGHQNIKGYHSEYYPDVDEYGRPARGVNINTNHWYGGFILWVFEWGFLILCIAIPIITWKQCTKIYERLPEKNLEQRNLEENK